MKTRRPLDCAYLRFRLDLSEWRQRRAGELVDEFLRTGRPEWQFSTWLEEKRRAEEGI